MRKPCFCLLAGLTAATGHAAPLVHEPFDYDAASPLTAQTGGSGWWDAWFQDGESAATASDGLAYTDGIGNVLDVSGRCADSTGSATTRSLRDLDAGLTNDVWISFLWELPASNSKFEGLSFYRGAQQVFSISNPSTTATANIVLTNNLNGASSNTQQGTFGGTHLVVVRLVKGGGSGGADLAQAFIDPLLSGNPPTAAATVTGTNFDFDRVRLAGQDGSPLRIDELRIGTTFADVTPHAAAGNSDGDGDGLTDAQEALLGLDPGVDDSALIAAVQAHPDWFGLYDAAGMLTLGNGGVVLPRTGEDPVNFTFEVQHSENLTAWPVLETFQREVELPAGKNFLRVTLQDR